MLASQTAQLQTAFQNALQTFTHSIDANITAPNAILEQPKDPAYGDIACTAALACAKALKKNPRDIATALKTALESDASVAHLIAAIDIAGPGFINIRLQPAAKHATITAILAQPSFGTGAALVGQNVMVEFVSANPTGPLHVGHTRQAAIGDILCNLMANQGALVTREFYYNDAGNQIHNLAVSVQAHLHGITPTLGEAPHVTDNPAWPENGYRGEYIADIARDFAAGKTTYGVTSNQDAEDLDAIRQFAVAYLRQEQDFDLQAFGLKFDVFYLESSLYSEGRVQSAVDRLIAAGKTYEEGGALWLRTTEYGDDKDRVMRKSDGAFTYFVPDVAYHIRKFERGFSKVINVQGTDHFGTIARVRAGLQAADVGIPANYPDYVLHSMVKVIRGGVEVKLSKRAGSYVTMRDLIEWVGRDAVRYFLVSRKADSEFVFDLDVALAKSDENPVYYIQYAHARMCSVFEKAQTLGLATTAECTSAMLSQVDLSPLINAKELALMDVLAQYPQLLSDAATNLAPHLLAFGLKDIASAFHSAYNAEKVLVDDAATRNARLALYAATRQVIAHGLSVLGMSAPEKM